MPKIAANVPHRPVISVALVALLTTLACSGEPVNSCEAMSFTAQLADLERQFLCLDAPPWERARAHTLIRHLTTAFLLDVLADDDDARRALRPAAVAANGLAYLTTSQ